MPTTKNISAKRKNASITITLKRAHIDFLEKKVLEEKYSSISHAVRSLVEEKMKSDS